MAKQVYLIKGTVLDEKTRQPVPAVYLEAWDKDLIYNDLVGGTTTNEAGEFRFRFDETYFRELFSDRNPDIFFKVIHKEVVIKSTEDSVLWNISGPGKDIEITIDRKLIQPEQDTIIATAVDFSIDDVVAQFARNENLPLEVVREYERELKRFLALASITHKPYGVTGPIGSLWRFFITSTYLYDGFCKKVNVAFLHHFLFNAQDKFPRRRLEDIQESYRTMLTDYEIVYKEKPPLHLWPLIDDLPDDTVWSWIDDTVLVFSAGNGVDSLGGVWGQNCDCCSAVG